MGHFVIFCYNIVNENQFEKLVLLPDCELVIPATDGKPIGRANWISTASD